MQPKPQSITAYWTPSIMASTPSGNATPSPSKILGSSTGPEQKGPTLQVPRIYIDRISRAKIERWVDQCKTECSGLGKVIPQGDGSLLVTEVYLLPQKNSATTTEIEAGEVAKLMYQTRQTPGELKFWWHSHVEMPVFWSGTDWTQIQEFGQHGWFVSSVFNKKREIRTCLYAETPFFFLADNLELELAQPAIDSATLEAWDQELKDKCKPLFEPTRHTNWPGMGKTPVGEFPARRLSKKERKRAKKEQEKQQKQLSLTPGASGTSSITDNTGTNPSDPAPDHKPSVEVNGNLERDTRPIRTPICIRCGLRDTCICSEEDLLAAYEADDVGSCCFCEFPFEHCDCDEGCEQELVRRLNNARYEAALRKARLEFEGKEQKWDDEEDDVPDDESVELTDEPARVVALL